MKSPKLSETLLPVNKIQDTKNSKLGLINEIKEYLKSEFDEMNSLMLNAVNVDEELIGVISNYLSEGGGKRIRPIITLLSFKMLNAKKEINTIVKLACAVEFIHMATLLHDDVVDGSHLRRFKPTANKLWGSQASILVGDFLFSKAFQLMVQTKSLDCLEIISNASTIIIEGEVSQLVQLHSNVNIDESAYNKIINAKTAALFAASAEVGIFAAGGNEEQCKSMKEFGSNIGVIFQLIDDYLDYFGNELTLGKKIGDDFFEGKITLPIILLKKNVTDLENKNIDDLFGKSNKSSEDLNYLINLLNKYDVQTIILNKANNLTQNSLQYLNKFNDSIAKNYLIKLVKFISERHY